MWVAAATLAVAVTLLWLVSLLMNDSSIADIFWGTGFVLVAWAAFLVADGLDGRRLLLMLLPSLWGVRLTSYLAWRNLGKGEDRRYTAMREKWGSRWWWWSYVQVFVFQLGQNLFGTLVHLLGNAGQAGHVYAITLVSRPGYDLV